MHVVFLFIYPYFNKDYPKGYGSDIDQQKDVFLFLDETGEPVAQQRDSSPLKNKEPSFC